MNFLRACIFLFFSLFFAISAFAQILNDSTENIYGPKTTRYFLEEDIYNSIDTLYALDTALNAFHRYTFPERYNYLYQDLGNKGTAIQPLFYEPPSNIGFRSGFNAYNLYYNNVLDIKFYDTKSPYSKFYYVQGGRGISFLETELSRNINPDWNLGIAFNRLSANSQIDFEPRPVNPEVDHYSYSAYTAYKTKNKKYFVGAYFRRMRHQVREFGGVDTAQYLVSGELPGTKKVNLSQLFLDYRGHAKELNNAISGDLRVNYHLYHQFTFSKLLGVYHLFDFESQRITYEDRSNPYNTEFYGIYLFDSTATPQEKTIFKVFRNDVGLKGEVDQFKYRLYYRRRNYLVDQTRLQDIDWQKEDIGGAEITYRFSERALAQLNGELLGNSTFPGQEKDYKVNFSFENRYIKANFTTGLYSPSFLQRLYFGNHNSWDYRNSFDQTRSTDLELSTELPLGFLKLSPHVKFSRIEKYLYFTRDEITGEVHPQQSENSFDIISPGLDINLKFWDIVFRNNFTYNMVSRDSLIYLPNIMDNMLLYYEKKITRKSHILQAGFDVKWTAGYKADGYMPSIQQFYVQNNVAINPYFLIDFFAAMKINRTRVFLRFSNLTRNHSGDNSTGYLVRPYYYGFVRVLDVGVNWMFFD